MIDFPDTVFEDRRARLRERLLRFRLERILITKPVDIFYFAGFRGSSGILLISRRRTLLWVDPRYTLQARDQSRGAEVRETREPMSRTVGAWIRKARPGALGYQDRHLTSAGLEAFRDEARARRGDSKASWRPVGPLLDELRIVKDRWEIELIRRSGKLTAEVFGAVLPLVRSGAREADLAAELEYRMKLAGAEGPAFETIVASGPRGAWPHARASRRRLRRGELVILDLGAILSGYAADMTRTVYVGVPGRRARKLYAAVADAQREAVESLRAGITGGQADAVARKALARRGLDEYFTHSTGHGVGLEVHEPPRLGRGDETPMPGGCVVTVEPGLYIEGYGGVRIEDTVLVEEKTSEILTPAPKEPWFTG